MFSIAVKRKAAMNKKMSGSLICMGILLWGAIPVSAWDFPLDVSPVEIQFNHTKANHALNIRKNFGTDIPVPEYSIYYPSYPRSEKFAYVKGDAPSVLVKFCTTSPDSLSLTIYASVS